MVVFTSIPIMTEKEKEGRPHSVVLLQSAFLTSERLSTVPHSQ